MVLPENVENPLDSEEKQSGSFTEGWSGKGVDDGDYEETVWLLGTPTKRNWSGKSLPAGHGAGKESERTSEEEIHGRDQGSHRERDDAGGVAAG